MLKYLLIFSILISYTFSQFLITNNGPCTCDLTPNICDIGCCCDLNCTSLQLQTFTCNTQISPSQFGCVPIEVLFGNNTSYQINNDGTQFCVFNDNYTLRNFYYTPNPLNVADITYFTLLPVKTSSFNAQSLFSSSINTFGSTIYTFEKGSYVGFLAMTGSSGGICTDGVAIGYLQSMSVTCQRVINNLSTDCVNLPGSNNFYKQNLLVASFPSAMLGEYNYSTISTNSNFVTPNYVCTPSPCSNIPVPSFNNPNCNNVLTSIIYTISGEAGITNVTIAMKFESVGLTYSQVSQVIFNKAGYNSSLSQFSGNPGYLSGFPVRTIFASQSIVNWLIPSSGDCSAGPQSNILFGFNSESDCSLNIANFANATTINANINSVLSGLLPTYVCPFGNSVTFNNTDWPLVKSETLNISTGAPNTNPLITKQTIYILYARTGTLTLPQNKIVGVKVNYAISDVSNTIKTTWISISVVFVDVSQPPFDVNAAVARLRSERSVKSFLYLFYVENSRADLVGRWNVMVVSCAVFVIIRYYLYLRE